MSLAAFTQPDIVSMIEAAALLSPISYLDHITAKFALKLVKLHIDEVCKCLHVKSIFELTLCSTELVFFLYRHFLHWACMNLI